MNKNEEQSANELDLKRLSEENIRLKAELQRQKDNELNEAIEKKKRIDKTCDALGNVLSAYAIGRVQARRAEKKEESFWDFFKI